MEQLREAHDICSLTKGVLELCEPYGPVHSFKLVHNRGALRVACFIELEQPKQQALLARELGVGAVNETLCLEIPVRKDFGSLCRASSTPKPPLQPQEQHAAQLAH